MSEHEGPLGVSNLVRRGVDSVGQRLQIKENPVYLNTPPPNEVIPGRYTCESTDLITEGYAICRRPDGVCLYRCEASANFYELCLRIVEGETYRLQSLDSRQSLCRSHNIDPSPL